MYRLFYLFLSIFLFSNSNWFIWSSNYKHLYSASSIFIWLWLTYSSPTLISCIWSFYFCNYLFLNSDLYASISCSSYFTSFNYFRLYVCFSWAKKLMASMLPNLVFPILFKSFNSSISLVSITLVLIVSLYVDSSWYCLDSSSWISSRYLSDSDFNS